MTDNELIQMLANHLRGVAVQKMPAMKKGESNTVTLMKRIRALKNGAAQMLALVESHQMDKGMVGALKMLEREGRISIDGDVVRLTSNGASHE